MKLTDRQLQILTFISMFRAIKERPPTYQEIGNAFGFTSRGAWDHVKALVKKGVIEKGRYGNCSIHITLLGQETLDLEKNTLAIEAGTMTAWEMVAVT